MELHYTMDIQSRRLQHSSIECISHIGLLPSAITHPAMALLSLSTPLSLSSHTHTNRHYTTLLFFSFHTQLFALGVFYTNKSYGLFTSIARTTHCYYYYNYNNNKQLISRLSICRLSSTRSIS